MRHDPTAAARPRVPRRWPVLPMAGLLLLMAIGLAVNAHPVVAAPSTIRAAADARGLHFGTAVTAGNLTGIAKYAAVTGREFNSITPGNEMKWGSVEPTQGQFNWTGADQIVSFAAANNMLVRGHTLVWHSQLPNWLTPSAFTSAQIHTLMVNHVTTEVTRFAGRAATWDVVNEPFNEDGTFRQSIFFNAQGQSYIPDALRAARAADPSAKLYINDFNIEGVNAKSTAMLNLVTSLKQQGVPIDGVGIQSHLILGQIPSDMATNIARFTALGLSVWLSELDVRMTLPATSAMLTQQATDYVKVVNACLAVKGCIGITVWGFTDFDSWVPGTFAGQGSADMFDTNFDPKPAYFSVLAALGGTPPTPTPSPSATAPSPTPTPTAGGGGPCQIAYRVVNQWNVGFTASIAITNTGAAAINGWTLRWSFPSGQTVTNGWAGTYSQSGAQVTVTNLPWDAAIAPNASISGIGFNGAHNGTNAVPTAFTLNGAACTVA
jgi:endo-1,4-beta-xylanase